MYGATIAFKWHGMFKKLGSVFFGTPPELDFILYTICAITRPAKSCPMKFGNKQFKIQTNLLDNVHIGSAYPIF